MTYSLIVTCLLWLSLAVTATLAFEVYFLRQQRDDAIRRSHDMAEMRRRG